MRSKSIPRPEAPPKSLIVEKVKSGIDGLITTLRDAIDAEVFEAGKGKLKVVAQIAVGFDNINRADANRYKIPFTHTADVLTEATAEFAFFIMGALARKLWTAEHLTRENQWGYWHPYLPFLGDEVTGKTIAIIGTGRIGLAMIKKCAGFDMNILCYDPAFQNHDYVNAIQETMDLRHARGISKTKNWIKYVSVDDALSQADFVSVHVPLLREGESSAPTYHLFNEQHSAPNEADCVPGEHVPRAGGRRDCFGESTPREVDCRCRAGCLRERTAACGFAAA